MLCSLGLFFTTDRCHYSKRPNTYRRRDNRSYGVTIVAGRPPDVRRVVRAGVAILVVAVLKDVVARLDTSLMNVSWCEFEQTRGYSEQDDMAGESLRIRRSGVCLRHVVPSDMYATIESLASSPCYSR
ncbi:hypothetical protein KXD40_001599 [Peronospora effusa]|nr:hypothetical protein KXD40_001599 [Peronospora effusa]